MAPASGPSLPNANAPRSGASGRRMRALGPPSHHFLAADAAEAFAAAFSAFFCAAAAALSALACAAAEAFSALACAAASFFSSLALLAGAAGGGAGGGVGVWGGGG